MSDLTALVARRLCHELAGPVGAIVTAVDLLDQSDDPEIRALLADSTAALMASLKLHRFVLSGGDTGDHRALLGAWAKMRGDLDVIWATMDDPSPAHAALLLGLAMIAAEAASGRATLTVAADRVEIAAARLVLDGHIADVLGGAEAATPRASLAAMAVAAAAREGRRVTVEATATTLRLTIA